MKQKVSKRAVDALADGIMWDPEVRGFGVRARGDGKFYLLKFRDAGGKQRWHTIGRHGSPWTPETARREAKRLLGEVAAGKAPGAPRGSATVASAVEAFIAAHAIHLRTGDEYAWLLRHHVVSRWGKRRLGAIRRADVAELLRDVQGDDRGQRVRIANRVRAALLRFFRWAIAEGLVDENPATSTERRPGEVKRERVLSDAEVAAVWNAAGNGTFGTIVRLLFLTGQRRTEVGGMRWEELDLGAASWTIPPERHKGGRGHTVPLSAAAVSVLTAWGAGEGAVFPPARGKGDTFAGWSKCKAALDKASGVTGWRLHDIRRTVATQMQAAGIQPHVIAAVLGHSQAGLFGVTAIYLRDQQEAAKRDALEAWEKRLPTRMKN